MKSRKTNQNKRDYYVYKHADGSSVTLNPGENGVTEMDIYNLHRLVCTTSRRREVCSERSISDELCFVS